MSHQAIKIEFDSNKNRKRIAQLEETNFFRPQKYSPCHLSKYSVKFINVPIPGSGREEGEFEMWNMVPGII